MRKQFQVKNSLKKLIYLKPLTSSPDAQVKKKQALRTKNWVHISIIQQKTWLSVHYCRSFTKILTELEMVLCFIFQQIILFILKCILVNRVNLSVSITTSNLLVLHV